MPKAAFFFDGQNFFNAAKDAFGYPYPIFDPLKIARAVSDAHGWTLGNVRFYTGLPRKEDWRHAFWKAKLNRFSRQGGVAITRNLRYLNPDEPGREKGIDVRIALDIVRLALQGSFDIGVLCSQDNDLAEAVREAKELAAGQGITVQFYSAYPYAPTCRNPNGVAATRQLRIEKQLYDSCLDRNDYGQKDRGY